MVCVPLVNGMLLHGFEQCGLSSGRRAIDLVGQHQVGEKALVPMQLLSYWIDVRVAGFSPEVAYSHQIGSFLLTLLFVYLILLGVLRNDRVTINADGSRATEASNFS